MRASPSEQKKKGKNTPQLASLGHLSSIYNLWHMQQKYTYKTCIYFTYTPTKTHTHIQYKVCQGCGSLKQSVLSTKLCARLRGKSNGSGRTKVAGIYSISQPYILKMKHQYIGTHTCTLHYTGYTHTWGEQQIVMQCNAKTIARARTSTTSSTTTQ